MELRDYLRILRAHWVGIVVLTALGVLVAAGWAALQPRVYTATTSGMVATTDASTDTGQALVSDQLAQAKVKSFVDIGTWREVAQYAIKDLKLDTTPEALVSHVTVTNPLDTVILQVSANASSPTAARDLAEAWVRGMKDQIARIESGSNAKADATPIVTLVPGDSAQLPSSPSSPNVKLALALGGLIGLAVGIGYAAVRNVLDRRVRNPREIERQTGATVVGTLPLEKDLKTERQLLSFTEAHPVAEAMRELRTNLQYMDVDNPPRVIVVTSPMPGDGKSTTAANLAVGLAAAGQRVMLIDADLRRPMVAKMFGLPEGAGLSDLLAGRATLQEVAHVPRGSRNLVVVAAGRIPPNPSEVLGSQRMHDLVSSLREEAMIIIDSPPVIPVTDAAVLATAADGALIVVSAGKTTYDLLQKSLDNLQRAHGRVLGVVLNKVPRKGADAGYYGYYSGYASYEPMDAAAPTPPTAPGPQRTSSRAQASSEAEAQELLQPK